MCFVLAGLNTYPARGKEAAKRDFGDMQHFKNEISVEVDGKWQYIRFCLNNLI